MTFSLINRTFVTCWSAVTPISRGLTGCFLTSISGVIIITCECSFSVNRVSTIYCSHAVPNIAIAQS